MCTIGTGTFMIKIIATTTHLFSQDWENSVTIDKLYAASAS